MVVHGTHHFLNNRMYMGVPMLCSVTFRQFPQIEDVAKLIFWMGTILILKGEDQLKWRLIARLASRLIIVLWLGW